MVQTNTMMKVYPKEGFPYQPGTRFKMFFQSLNECEAFAKYLEGYCEHVKITEEV